MCWCKVSEKVTAGGRTRPSEAAAAKIQPDAQEMLTVNISANQRRIIQSVRVKGYLSQWHVFKMCHIIFSSHGYYTTVISVSGGDSGRVRGDKTAKHVRAKPLDIFDEWLGCFNICKSDISGRLSGDLGTIFFCVRGNTGAICRPHSWRPKQIF